jgi:hypothetical protein
MNRLPGFACRTVDSALGLGYSVSKVLQLRNLSSEFLTTFTQSENTIVQLRTIIHCTRL